MYQPGRITKEMLIEHYQIKEIALNINQDVRFQVTAVQATVLKSMLEIQNKDFQKAGQLMRVRDLA